MSAWVRAGAHVINQDHIVRFSDVSCSGDNAKPRTAVELVTGKTIILDMSREEFGRAAGMVFPDAVPTSVIVQDPPPSRYFFGRN
jgi:hypothetical protein